jgi:hypothetical protein
MDLAGGPVNMMASDPTNTALAAATGVPVHLGTVDVNGTAPAPIRIGGRLGSVVRLDDRRADAETDEALALFHAQLSLATHFSVNTRHLEPWLVYERLLDDYVGEHPRHELQLLWDAAYVEQQYQPRDEQHRPLGRPDLPAAPRLYKPLITTATYELHAQSAQEFGALILLLISRSGMSAHQVALRAPSIGPARLNPSQLYSILKQLKRGVLSRKAAQIRSLGEASGLDEHQVQQLLRVWAGLREEQLGMTLAAAALPCGEAGRQAIAAVPDSAGTSTVTALVRHRPRYENRQDQPDDGMRAVVQNWIDRTEAKLHARQGFAPAEPTEPGAVAEAVLMAKRVRERYVDTSLDGDSA